jgi:hypothetical protein
MRDSNVRKFSHAYTDRRFYLEGIGTRHGFVGKFVGAATGKGGKIRIVEALEELDRNFADGYYDIDITGFSRGTALALHFANEIHEEGSGAAVRFLGLWDVVASFGIPGNDLNINWTLTLPDNVRKCYHAMGLDERRENFPLARVRTSSGAPAGERLQEVWFRGVHSEVGGARTIGLTCITLGWMLRRAREDGLPIDDAAIRKWEAECDAGASIWPNDDFKPGHESVRPRGTVGGAEHNDPPPGVVIARG